MSHSIRFDPDYVSKVQRAKYTREVMAKRECVDRAFVRLNSDDVAAEVEDAKRRAEIARVFLAR